jgi:hypothetical protein
MDDAAGVQLDDHEVERKPLDLLHRAASVLMSQAGSTPVGPVATPPPWQDHKEAVPRQLPWDGLFVPGINLT